MSRPKFVCLAAMAFAAAAGLALMSRFGPLQWPSVLVYGGLVAFFGGLVSALLPPRWLGFSRRLHAAMAGLLAGVVLFAAGWFWPARTFTTPSPVTRLDFFMPDYSFQERHEITVQASPERVRAELDRISFADLKVMETLGRIRNAAMGSQGRPAGVPAKPIIEMVRSPRSGFFLLDDTPREFLFGLAGQPWNNAGVRLTPEEFRTWAKPGNIKVAANFLIEDAGSGRSRIITETRIAAADGSARNKMAKYWALVYPGSGMIRRSLLESIRARAERP